MPREMLITIRKGLESEWTSSNPILEIGEPGFETDTNKLKIGDGVSTWNELQYIRADGGEI